MSRKIYRFLLVLSFVLISFVFFNYKVISEESILKEPKLIQNVNTADSWFFNFRLTNFAPETEDLIKGTFGNKLVFEKNHWEYNSYNSHAVSFSTNLPSIAVIEYGETTAYGNVTAQSDSYYYNHLLYIKGLEEGNDYHYRIVIKDYDGTIIRSKDYTFTTKTFTEDVIKVTNDMVPFNITQSGTYVLVEDIVSDTLGINIKAHDVTIDLNGFTLIYDNGTPKVTGTAWNHFVYDEKASYGIRLGLWNFRNPKIFNGTIKQGKTGSWIMEPIMLTHQQGTSEIAGVTLDYYGADTNGASTGITNFHHNVVYDRGTVVSNRHQGVKALFMGGDANSIVAYNSFRRFRHQGIMGSGYKHHNELYSDSFDTNSFLIGVNDGDRVEYNKLFGVGYNPVGTSWDSNSQISNNFIYLHCTAPNMRSSEYNRLSGVAGMRLTLYDGNSTLFVNALYDSNTIVLKAWEDCSIARGIWTATGDLSKNVVYQNNTVKVEAITDNLPYSDVNFSVTAVDINGTDREIDGETPPTMYFYNNHLISNVNFIQFGSSYGIGGSAYFYNTTLERINKYDSNFKPIKLGYWYWNTFNNRLIDTVTKGFDLDESPAFHGSTGYMEVSYGVSHKAQFVDESNKPLVNKTITLTIDGSRTMSIKTDHNGNAKFDVLTVQHLKPGGGQGAAAGKVTQIDYSKYVFSLEEEKSVTMNLSTLTSKEVIMIGTPVPEKISLSWNITYTNNMTSVTATIKTNKPIHTPAGWIKISDTEYAKKYTKNTEETVTIKDFDGNSSKITISITQLLDLSGVKPDLEPVKQLTNRGVVVEALGSSSFDNTYQLVIEKIDLSQADILKYNQKIGFIIAGNELLDLYEVTIYKNGVIINEFPEGIKVKFPKNEYVNYDSLQLFYVDDTGAIIFLETNLTDEYLEAITTHLSKFGISGKETKETISPTENIKTSVVSKLGEGEYTNFLVLILALIASTGIIILSSKQKSLNKINKKTTLK